MKKPAYSGRTILHTALIVPAVFALSYVWDRRNSMVLTVILFALCLLLLGILCLLKTRLLFGDEELVAETRLCGRIIKRAAYRYKDIYKFILAKNYGAITLRKYAVYVDMADKIIKIKTESYYRDCIKIMEQVKEKANELFYDATDELYKTEDDMFRNYYKMKRMVEDVKNDP